MKRLSLLSGLLLLSLVNGHAIKSLNSDLQDWTVTNGNGSITANATVPGGIYTDLQAAGILDDVFYRFNDIEYRWVSQDNWTYQTNFEMRETFDMKIINLVLHGVDTVASIYLNGQLLGSVSNMFVRHVFDIKNIVQEDNNTLTIEFTSPIYAANQKAEQAQYPVPPGCGPDVQHGECHINFLRKMQASFSWDWGPAFPSVGLWKPIEIEAYNTAMIRDITSNVTRLGDYNWTVDATVYIESATEQLGEHVLIGSLSQHKTKKIIAETKAWKIERDVANNNTYGFIAYLHFEPPETMIDVWWPNGYGNQTLYSLGAIYVPADDDNDVSSKDVQIGLRTIKLVQEEVQPGAEGLSFYFEVNGVPIFAKGANWIPGHVLPELGYDEDLVRHALSSAKEANMNMLRVWGGGVYESDLFYQVANELGILIWQDMMFAVALYPTDNEFTQSVKVETEQQIKRLQNNPCIAVWAGNNENEALLSQNWVGFNDSDYERYKQDYIKLYVETIQPIVEKLDPTRAYTISSPSNGLHTIEEGYISSNPFSPLYGDVHYYNYLNDPWNASLYPNTRFASEYGFQAWPSLKSLSNVSTEEDRHADSQFVQQRQHHTNGNTEITNLIKHHLPLPDDDGSEEYFKTWIYYSQIYQAMGIKTESEKYRRDRSKLTSTNEGTTMGALYWQLNDVWQAPTWASIEFGGRWKMLHFYAKKFFAPVLISPELTDDNQVNVYVISDLLQYVFEVEVNITVYSWDSFETKSVTTTSLTVPSLSSSIQAKFSLTELLTNSQCEPTTCFVYFTLKGSDFFSDNILYPSALSAATNLQPAIISVNVEEIEGSYDILIRLETDKIAPFVWLETDAEGEFSDNGFILLSNTQNIMFGKKKNETVDVDLLRNTLTVKSLLH